MNLNEFHKNGQRNLLIAPAGHGKTYTISELANINDNDLPYLILTHTHAGVASLKEKIVEHKVNNNKYILTTIHGFCLILVKAYVKDYESIPLQEKDTDNFYKYLCYKATELIEKKVISDVLKASYSGVIIDEYQDCNIAQHSFALKLAKIIPLKALGDPLQRIFDFKDSCVDFKTDFKGFSHYNFLDKPWRWINSGNELLGEKILKCRDHLIMRKEDSFHLLDDPKANFHIKKNFDINSPLYLKEIGRFIRGLKTESLLIIIPSKIKYKNKKGIFKTFCSINHRADIRNRMGLMHGFFLLEAIDNKDFYDISKKLDKFFTKKIVNSEIYVKKVCNLMEIMTMGVSKVKEFINVDNGKFIKKKQENDQQISNYIKLLFLTAFENQRKQDFLKILKYFLHHLKTPIKRPELFYDLLSAIESSIVSKTILENMIDKRNMLRRQGRKVKGKVIGTTLLTKGLEFDTVVVFQADMLEDRRNFYVAISRASKELYLITDSENITLKP